MWKHHRASSGPSECWRVSVLAKFRATGPGWQTRINEALRRARV